MSIVNNKYTYNTVIKTIAISLLPLLLLISIVLFDYLVFSRPKDVSYITIIFDIATEYNNILVYLAPIQVMIIYYFLINKKAEHLFLSIPLNFKYKFFLPIVVLFISFLIIDFMYYNSYFIYKYLLSALLLLYISMVDAKYTNLVLVYLFIFVTVSINYYTRLSVDGISLQSLFMVFLTIGILLLSNYYYESRLYRHNIRVIEYSFTSFLIIVVLYFYSGLFVNIAPRNSLTPVNMFGYSFSLFWYSFLIVGILFYQYLQDYFISFTRFFKYIVILVLVTFLMIFGLKFEGNVTGKIRLNDKQLSEFTYSIALIIPSDLFINYVSITQFDSSKVDIEFNREIINKLNDRFAFMSNRLGGYYDDSYLKEKEVIVLSTLVGDYIIPLTHDDIYYLIMTFLDEPLKVVINGDSYLLNSDKVNIFINHILKYNDSASVISEYSFDTFSYLEMIGTSNYNISFGLSRSIIDEIIKEIEKGDVSD